MPVLPSKAAWKRVQAVVKWAESVMSSGLGRGEQMDHRARDRKPHPRPTPIPARVISSTVQGGIPVVAWIGIRKDAAGAWEDFESIGTSKVGGDLYAKAAVCLDPTVSVEDETPIMLFINSASDGSGVFWFPPPIAPAGDGFWAIPGELPIGFAPNRWAYPWVEGVRSGNDLVVKPGGRSSEQDGDPMANAAVNFFENNGYIELPSSVSVLPVPPDKGVWMTWSGSGYSFSAPNPIQCGPAQVVIAPP